MHASTRAEKGYHLLGIASSQPTANHTMQLSIASNSASEGFAPESVFLQKIVGHEVCGPRSMPSARRQLYNGIDDVVVGALQSSNNFHARALTL